ncbi:hypothetical protein BH720_010615 [Desertifilum tharense IPPAS B-1220]|nr:hypothetical protein [Desertifilum sp. FACHB-1129]
MRASGNIRSEDRGLWRSQMGTNPISASFGQFRATFPEKALL